MKWIIKSYEFRKVAFGNNKGKWRLDKHYLLFGLFYLTSSKKYFDDIIKIDEFLSEEIAKGVIE